MLVDNTFKAVEFYGHKTVVLAGGVSANSELRQRMKAECESRGLNFYCPPLKYCGDNAAMVGIQAGFEFSVGNIADEGLNAYATMPIDNIIK